MTPDHPLVAHWPWPGATAYEKRKLRGRRKAMRRRIRAGASELSLAIRRTEELNRKRAKRKKRERRERRLDDRALVNANWRAWYRKNGRFAL